jgi:hypothetical protein
MCCIGDRSVAPLAVRDFLEGRREVETAIAYEALRWPVNVPLDADVIV